MYVLFLGPPPLHAGQLLLKTLMLASYTLASLVQDPVNPRTQVPRNFETRLAALRKMGRENATATPLRCEPLNSNLLLLL
jgi:hypothetical protein